MPVLEKKRFPPCQNCRNQHRRCDLNQPSCLRCRRRGYVCTRKNYAVRFCHDASTSYNLFFAADQPWMDIKKSDLEYVDETAEISRQYSQSSSPEDATHQPNEPAAIYLRSSSGQSTGISRYSAERGEAPSSLNSAYTPYYMQNLLQTKAIPTEHAQTLQYQNYESWLLPLLPKHAKEELNPLEACLMRYFVEQLAPWLDLCDSARHFATVVPQRAWKCPPLLNAIFTTSARHLSRISRYRIGWQVVYDGYLAPGLTTETAIHYHNKCISHLVSLSNCPLEAENENLLAAAIILRFYEEVDAPSKAEDKESAIRGIQIFLDTQALSAALGSGLRHAAYWVALRQEALTAFAKQRPFRLSLEPCEPYRSFEPADDYTWANRLVIHFVDVLQYCFGTDKNIFSDPQEKPVHSTITSTTTGIPPAQMTSTAVPVADTTFADRISRYEELLDFERLWTEHGPSSFRPIYSNSPDLSSGKVLPEIWFLSTCHVVGMQHLELARMLLAIYNPRLPRIGLNQHAVQRSVDREMKRTILGVCGIALSNRRIPPALLTASTVISMCGDIFSDEKEQLALLDVLAELEIEHAWPTHSAQTQLKETWGWMNAESSEL